MDKKIERQKTGKRRATQMVLATTQILTIKAPTGSQAPIHPPIPLQIVYL